MRCRTPHPRTKNTHTLGNAGMGTSRCTPKLSGKWAGAAIVNFGATNHWGCSRQGTEMVWGRVRLLLPFPRHTHLAHNTFQTSRETQQNPKDTFRSVKNVHSETLQTIFNGLYLTLPQTFTVGENGFSSMHSCPGNVKNHHHSMHPWARWEFKCEHFRPHTARTVLSTISQKQSEGKCYCTKGLIWKLVGFFFLLGAQMKTWPLCSLE